MPSIVRKLKERARRDREPRFALSDKYELACALATIIMGGVKATTNESVILVSHILGWMRTLTDDPKLLRMAWSHNEITEACIAEFDSLVNGYFERLDPPVFADIGGHNNRVFLTTNQKVRAFYR